MMVVSEASKAELLEAAAAVKQHKKKKTGVRAFFDRIRMPALLTSNSSGGSGGGGGGGSSAHAISPTSSAAQVDVESPRAVPLVVPAGSAVPPSPAVVPPTVQSRCTASSSTAHSAAPSSSHGSTPVPSPCMQHTRVTPESHQSHTRVTPTSGSSASPSSSLPSPAPSSSIGNSSFPTSPTSPLRRPSSVFASATAAAASNSRPASASVAAATAAGNSRPVSATTDNSRPTSGSSRPTTADSDSRPTHHHLPSAIPLGGGIHLATTQSCRSMRPTSGASSTGSFHSRKSAPGDRSLTPQHRAASGRRSQHALGTCVSRRSSHHGSFTAASCSLANLGASQRTISGHCDDGGDRGGDDEVVSSIEDSDDAESGGGGRDDEDDDDGAADELSGAAGRLAAAIAMTRCSGKGGGPDSSSSAKKLLAAAAGRGLHGQAAGQLKVGAGGKAPISAPATSSQSHRPVPPSPFSPSPTPSVPSRMSPSAGAVDGSTPGGTPGNGVYYGGRYRRQSSPIEVIEIDVTPGSTPRSSICGGDSFSNHSMTRPSTSATMINSFSLQSVPSSSGNLLLPPSHGSGQYGSQQYMPGARTSNGGGGSGQFYRVSGVSSGGYAYHSAGPASPAGVPPASSPRGGGGAVPSCSPRASASTNTPADGGSSSSGARSGSNGWIHAAPALLLGLPNAPCSASDVLSTTNGPSRLSHTGVTTSGTRPRRCSVGATPDDLSSAIYVNTASGRRSSGMSDRYSCASTSASTSGAFFTRKSASAVDAPTGGGTAGSSAEYYTRRTVSAAADASTNSGAAYRATSRRSSASTGEAFCPPAGALARRVCGSTGGTTTAGFVPSSPGSTGTSPRRSSNGAGDVGANALFGRRSSNTGGTGGTLADGVLVGGGADRSSIGSRSALELMVDHLAFMEGPAAACTAVACPASTRISSGGAGQTGTIDAPHPTVMHALPAGQAFSPALAPPAMQGFTGLGRSCSQPLYLAPHPDGHGSGSGGGSNEAVPGRSHGYGGSADAVHVVGRSSDPTCGATASALQGSAIFSDMWPPSPSRPAGGTTSTVPPASPRFSGSPRSSPSFLVRPPPVGGASGEARYNPSWTSHGQPSVPTPHDGTWTAPSSPAIPPPPSQQHSGTASPPLRYSPPRSAGLFHPAPGPSQPPASDPPHQVHPPPGQHMPQSSGPIQPPHPSSVPLQPHPLALLQPQGPPQPPSGEPLQPHSPLMHFAPFTTASDRAATSPARLPSDERRPLVFPPAPSSSRLLGQELSFSLTDA